MQRLDKAEEHFVLARNLHATHFPESLDFANCLNNLGDLYLLMTRPKQAEEQWLQACQIYAKNFPQSLDFAQCLILALSIIPPSNIKMLKANG